MESIEAEQEVTVSSEWIPIVTAVSSLLGAGVGGWVGGRQSRKNQERQHELDRQREISTRSLAKADEAIAALRFLQVQQRVVVDWRYPTSHHPYLVQQTRAAHDVLGGAIEYLTDGTVREQVATVHFLISTGYIGRGVGEPHRALDIVWRTCSAGIGVLGRYLRNEPTAPLPHDLLIEQTVRQRILEKEFDEAERQREGEATELDF